MLPYTSFFATLGLPQALVFLAIGLAFGFILEASGFGDSRKLSAQFYLTELTVLKVMFTGIIVACVLVALASAFGVMDFDRVFVNPTYLPSGIVGGLIMGVGFIVGGYCPGTSLVSAATGKLDGIAFVGGGLTGVWVFGESHAWVRDLYHAAPLGRLTVPVWLGLPTGVVVLLLVLMALTMFWGAEIAEQFFGRQKAWSAVRLLPVRARSWAAIGALLGACALLIVRGQPDSERRWVLLGDGERARLASRQVFIQPAEVVELRSDPSLYVEVLDVRSEPEYNLFHLERAQRLEVAALGEARVLQRLLAAPENTIYFLIGNGEAVATQAYKRLRGAGLANLYIVEGGVNRWLELYPLPACVAVRRPSAAPEELAYTFRLAAGARLDAAHPESLRHEDPCGGSSVKPEPSPVPPFERKVVLRRKLVVKGGCG